MAAHRHLDLRFHDIDASHKLGNRMLNLDTRIDFDEVERAVGCIHQEFDRARTHIAGLAAYLQCGLAQSLPLALVEIGCGCAFDHLLVATLDRTIAFEQVEKIAVAITQYLHFDMARAADQLFKVNLVTPESSLCFTLAGTHRIHQPGFILDRAHTAPAAAPAGLQHQRIANLRRYFLDLRFIVGQRLGSRHHWDPRADRNMPRRHLVTQRAHGSRARTDEDDISFGASFGKIRIFRQEAITGMDRVNLRLLRNRDDPLPVEIGRDWPCAVTQMISFVRLEPVQRELVFLGIDGDGADAQFGCGAEDPDRNFAAVGDEKATNRFREFQTQLQFQSSIYLGLHYSCSIKCV